MSEVLGLIRGMYSGSAKSELLEVYSEGDVADEVIYTSRGNYPNHGSGPYFKAVAKATGIRFADGSTFYSRKPYWGDYTTDTYREYHACMSTIGGRCYWAGGCYVGYGTYYLLDVSCWYNEGFYKDGAGNVYVKTVSGSKYFGLGARRRVTNSPSAWIQAAMDLPDSMYSFQRSTQLVARPDGRLGTGVKKISTFIGANIVYKNNELDTFNWAHEFAIFVNGSASRFATAYSDAVDNLDLSSVNTLANVVESADLLVDAAIALRSFFRKDYANLLKKAREALDPRDIWLKYRYVFTTTRLDLKEYAKTLQRLGDLASIRETITSNGFYADETGTYKVSIRIPVEEIIPTDTVSFLAAIGAEPTWVNLWDLVPYSFIVDWFLHVSEILEAVERWGSAIDLPIQSCWFTYMSEYDSQHVFYRVSGRRPDIPPIIKTRQASGRTIKMRIADALSLIR